MHIDFRSLTESDLPSLRKWFRDRELARRISYPTDSWFTYVTSNPQVRCWLAQSHERMLAMMQVDESDDGTGYIDIALNPVLRGRGIGRAVLSAFLRGPGGSYPALEAYVEPDNAASIATFASCGFLVQLLPEADGMRRLVHSKTVLTEAIRGEDTAH